VLEPFAGKSVYANHGERVVVGQRLMQAASDIFLGWTSGEEARHCYVRQLRDIKIKPLVEIMKPADLVSYAEACGWALARAHARSGDAAVLAGYMGKGGTFDEAIADFGELNMVRLYQPRRLRADVISLALAMSRPRASIDTSKRSRIVASS
jgi:hypothetical protein